MKGYLRRRRELVRTCVLTVVPNPSRDRRTTATLRTRNNFSENENEY